MNHTILLIALFLPAMCVAADAPNQPAPPSNPSGTMKFTRFSVRDPQINNVEACNMLIPEGWQPVGKINWFPNLSVLANADITVTDPHTNAAIQILPRQNFVWLTNPVVPMQPGTNYGGNIVLQPMDIPPFIPALYGPQARPELQHAKMIDKQDLPALAQQVQQAYGGQTQVRSARCRYEYQSGGKPWLEDVYLTMTYTPSQIGTLWGVYGAFAFRAPKDQLDTLTPLMFASITSFKLTPDWYGGYMYVQQLFTQRGQQAIADAKALSDTITQNGEEIRKQFADSYKNQSQVEDQTSKNFSQYIRGVDEYTDPIASRPIELPSGYGQAWANGNGEYILSNDPGFNPNVGSTANWQAMKKSGQ
jgi:hypothetical protein